MSKDVPHLCVSWIEGTSDVLNPVVLGSSRDLVTGGHSDVSTLYVCYWEGTDFLVKRPLGYPQSSFS